MLSAPPPTSYQPVIGNPLLASGLGLSMHQAPLMLSNALSSGYGNFSAGGMNMLSQLGGLPASIFHALPQGVSSVPKEARELFIGNVPPGTAESILLEFLNAAMRQVGFVQSGSLDPILACRMNNKFAFIECRSVEDTSSVLKITNIPFMGSLLKIGRPSKYVGPPDAPCTWQQLLGQPTDIVAAGDPTTKPFRELFIGNTAPDMTEIGIREFIGGALQKMGLTIQPDNPVVQVRINGRFAFVELRSIEETANCLNLNGVPFMGQPLKINRPTKFVGPAIPYFTWEDIMARFMSGELKLTTAGQPSRAIKLENMAAKKDLADATTSLEIIEDTKEECSQYGTVQYVLVPRAEDGQTALKGVGKVYVIMSTEEEAKKALLALKGRTFDGRIVDVKFFPVEQLLRSPPDYSDPPSQCVTAVGAVPVEVVLGSSMALGVGLSAVQLSQPPLPSSLGSITSFQQPSVSTISLQQQQALEIALAGARAAAAAGAETC